MSLKKLILVFIGFFFVAACVQKEKEHVINLKDVIPTADDSKPIHTDAAKKDTTLGFNLNAAHELNITVQHVKIFDLPLLPDRFNPKSTIKLFLFEGKDSILFSQWVYQDSSHTQNAFYNWLDCFGKNCRSFKIGQKSRFQNESFILFVNDTILTYLSSPLNLNPKQWIHYFEKNNAIESWKYVVFQPKHSKTNWFNVTDKQMKLL